MSRLFGSAFCTLPLGLAPCFPSVHGNSSRDVRNRLERCLKWILPYYYSCNPAIMCTSSSKAPEWLKAPWEEGLPEDIIKLVSYCKTTCWLQIVDWEKLRLTNSRLDHSSTVTCLWSIQILELQIHEINISVCVCVCLCLSMHTHMWVYVF